MALSNSNFRLIVDEIETALSRIDTSDVSDLVSRIAEAEKVFLVGVGRVMFVLQAFCKRLNHLGVRAWCVGGTNEPAITVRDLLIVGSGSGESVIPVAIARKASECGVAIAYVGSNATSTLRNMANLFVRIPVRTKLALPDEAPSRQPMTTLFEQALSLLFDAIVLMVIERNRIDIDALWAYHANLE